MSRLKRYTAAIVSGYVLLGANTLYSLASVPLALHYLSQAQFALWALSAQIAGYLALIDFGIGPAFGRILMDYKDRDEYGSTLLTGLLVRAVQGALIVIGGLLLSLIVGPALGIPITDVPALRMLVIAQCLLTAFSFVLRVFLGVLNIHQRYDLGNWVQTLMFLVSWSTLWLAFRAGAGVFSVIWAQAASVAGEALLCLCLTIRLRLLPQRGRWGRPHMKQFREMSAFGKDVFLMSIGAQVISTAQMFLITKVAGLEQAAVWTVCTRLLALASQALARLFDFSSAALTEMMIRGERERLRHRFRGLLQITLAFAAVGGALLAVCNQPFVQVWTRGKISWPQINDVLLGMMLFVSAFTRTSSGFICITKDLRGLRYVNFVEGIVLVCSGYVLLRWFGIPGLLTASVVTSALISGAYALRRCIKFFTTSAARVLIDWLGRPILVLACLAPVAAMVWLCSRWLSPIAACIVNGALVGTCGILLAVRVGIDQHLIQEFILRAPAPVSKVMSYIAGPRRRPEAPGAASEIQ